MEFVPMQTPRIQTGNGPNTGAAAASQVSFYLPLLPSAEESFARMHNLALHPSGARPKPSSLCKLSRSFSQIDFRQAWSMADHPCFGIKFKVLIGN